MNCFEKLELLTRECEKCILKAKIIEFEELPEEEKYNFDSYDKDQDLIVYCEPCDTYKHLNTDTL